MDNTVSANSTANVPLSPILKTALETVNKPTTTSNGGSECFPEDRVSKDYYFDSYAHL